VTVSDDVYVGEPVAILGDAGETQGILYGAITATGVTETTVDESGEPVETLTGGFRISIPAHPGFSGAPILGANSTVIGIAEAAGNGQTYATPMAAVPQDW
jgi:S1-C subfamily serine protease